MVLKKRGGKIAVMQNKDNKQMIDYLKQKAQWDRAETIKINRVASDKLTFAFMCRDISGIYLGK